MTPTAEGVAMRKLLIPVLRSALPALIATSLLGACSHTDRAPSEAAGGPSTEPSAGADTTVTEPSAGAETTATTAPVPATAPTTAPAGDQRPPTPGPTPQTGGSCSEALGWPTGPRTAAPMLAEDLYLVRVGRHECYDRVVFDLNSVVPGADVAGYAVAYVDGEVTADASGEPVPTAGRSALQIVVRAPIWGTSGHQPWRPAARIGDDLVPVAELRGWSTFQQIAFAGSFEGTTTIAVGLPAELPFRVGSYERDGYTHVYVDVAHPAEVGS